MERSRFNINGQIVDIIDAGAVRSDRAQSLTAAQQAQAQENIGVDAIGDDTATLKRYAEMTKAVMRAVEAPIRLGEAECERMAQSDYYGMSMSLDVQVVKWLLRKAANIAYATGININVHLFRPDTSSPAVSEPEYTVAYYVDVDGTPLENPDSHSVILINCDYLRGAYIDAVDFSHYERARLLDSEIAFIMAGWYGLDEAGTASKAMALYNRIQWLPDAGITLIECAQA